MTRADQTWIEEQTAKRHPWSCGPRAKMSDREARLASFPTPSTPYLMAWAEREAEAILAETEPETEVTDHAHNTFFLACYDAERAALAVALAAFVEG